MKQLRKGFTTGTAAAAATKAALNAMNGQKLTLVAVTLPDSSQLSIPVQAVGCYNSGEFFAEVIKDGGDDPDATDGIVIRSVVKKTGVAIRIIGGTGVGRVTKPGLPITPGEWAINPVPRQMILQAIVESTLTKGLEVRIEVPDGEKVAVKTLNPRLGIIGGISILGTTGIVEPMSEESWREALAAQLGVIKAAGYETVVLTPGRQGLNWAIHSGIPEPQIAEMSNFVGYMLEESVELGFTKVLLWGHYGKLIKIAAGVFNTHSQIADARLETLAAITAISGGTSDLVSTILNANTSEEAVAILTELGLERQVLAKIAERISQKAQAKWAGISVGSVLLDRQGAIRGNDATAIRIVEDEKWPMNW